MFTLQQVTTAHAKVKSGADFPSYVQELIALGIEKYDHYVTDGHSLYYGSNGYTVTGPAKYSPTAIAVTGNKERLQQSITIHQQGQTDYLTFCSQAAAVGIEKWMVDMQRMACIYYDKNGTELLIEPIPMPH